MPTTINLENATIKTQQRDGTVHVTIADENTTIKASIGAVEWEVATDRFVAQRIQSITQGLHTLSDEYRAKFNDANKAFDSLTTSLFAELRNEFGIRAPRNTSTEEAPIPLEQPTTA